jgi:hypothetical protein
VQAVSNLPKINAAIYMPISDRDSGDFGMRQFGEKTTERQKK